MRRDFGRLSAVFGILLLSAVSAHAQFRVARHGHATCTIVRQSGATPAEAHAADELAATLGKITGAMFTVRDSLPTDASPAIVVGPGAIASEKFAEVDCAKLGSDELVERTRGRYLLLAGGRPRGTLYAVYRFLADTGGARWWTAWATDLPHQPDLNCPTLKVDDRPAFEYREPYWMPALNGDWAVRNAANGETMGLTATQGGSVRYHQFVHTFYPLVPPATYFATHPEWYSLVNGKRTASNAQLCLTNPELRDFVVGQVREILRAEPDVNIVSVSQNDCFGACECPNCKAIDDAEGSHAGTMIDFVNYVADRIRPEFPNVAIDTLAYQYTRHAPRTIRPRPNVIVRLCSIECNFGAPLDDKTNAAFFDDLNAWSKRTNRLYIWDYSTNFAHYVQPHPNWFALGPDIRLFANHSVKGVFSEGAYQSDGSEMSELRGWLLARLMWNPNADADRLIDEFLRGYYGTQAAPFIRRYLDRMQVAAKGTYLTCYTATNAPFLHFGPLYEAETLWRRAEAAAANDPEKSWRVRQGHLPVQYVWIARWTALQREARQAGVAWPLPKSRKVYAANWLATATGPGPAGWTPMTHLTEGGQTPQSWVASLGPDPLPPGPPLQRLANAPIPTDIPGLRGGIDVQDDRATLAEEGTWAEVRADTTASDGAAVWMPCNHTEWAFQIPVAKLPQAAQTGKWAIYASIRVEPKTGASIPAHSPAPFTAGVWDTDARTSRAETRFPPIPGDAGSIGQYHSYHSYRIGTLDFKAGQYIWVAPVVSPDFAAVWVDRVYLVPVLSQP
jgi:hypothetical protein